MKKFVCFFSIFFAGVLSLSAQGLFKLKVEGSYLFTLPNAQFESISSTEDVSQAFSQRESKGFRAGFGADLNLGSLFFVNSGVQFVYNKDKFSLTPNMKTGSLSIESASAEQKKLYIPLQLGLRMAFLSVQAGPYFTTTIESKGQISSADGKKEEVNLLGELGDTFSAMKQAKYEMGVGAQAQCYLGSMYLFGGVDLGLYDDVKKAWNSSEKGSFSNHLKKSLFFVGLGISF